MIYGGDRDRSTICAVSTPSGFGGISVIRLSGINSENIIRKVFSQFPKIPESHKIYLGHLKDPLTTESIDQCLFSYFAEGKSYTGETTVEISCHGSPTICDRILKALISVGAQAARPGEFTYRAFMNNNLDLIQAEGVLNLIESRSQKSAQLAFRQLMGGLSEKIEKIESEMTWCLAHIEASIDFSTEGLETTTQEELINKLSTCENDIQKILKTYQTGRLIKDGLQVALVGKPNVGKSSLLNLLLGYDRSIVSQQAGTTRDVVSEELIHKGQRIVFLDTAGIRLKTADDIELIGMKKTKEVFQNADLCLIVFDLNQPLDWSMDFLDPDLIIGKNILLIANKSDLVTPEIFEKFMKFIQTQNLLPDAQVIFSTTFDSHSKESILNQICKTLLDDEAAENEVLLANARHFENLKVSSANISSAIAALKAGDGAELVSLDLKEALISLQDMLGKRFDDQIMDRVFKEFCIGK